MRALRRFKGWVVFAFFLLTSVLLYLPVILGKEIFEPGDFVYNYLFFNHYLLGLISRAAVPVWNLYNYSGQPFLADPQASAFYPVKDLLLFLARLWRSGSAEFYFLELNSIFHLTLAGYFTFLLVRRLLDDAWAGVISGVTFAFSGFLTGYPMLQSTILQTSVWLPLVLWYLLLAFEGDMWRYWILASVFYSISFLAGHPQMFWMASYVILVWVLFLWRRYRTRWSVLLPRVALFYGMFLLLSAPQLLPTMEFAKFSARIHAGYRELSGGLPLRDAWQVVFPSIFTRFSPLYAGVTSIGLWVLSLGWLFHEPGGDRGDEASGVVFWTVVAVFFFLLSFGGNAFLYPLVYKFVPGGALFRDQERAAYIAVFSLAMLSGYGFSFLKRNRNAAFRYSAAFVVVSLALLAGLMYEFHVPLEVLYENHSFMFKVMKLFGAGALLLILSKGGLEGRAARYAVVVFVLLDLSSAAYGVVTVKQNLALWNPFGASMSFVQRNVRSGGISGRVHNEYQLPGDYGMFIRVEDTLGGSSLRIGRYKTLFDSMPLGRFWEITGTEYVVTWRKELFVPAELVGTIGLPGGKKAYFYRLVQPYPKARVVHRVRCVPDGEALKLLSSFDFDLKSDATLPPQQCSKVSDLVRRKSYRKDEVMGIVSDETGEVRLSVTSPDGGLLVVSFNWMPGWHAYLVDASGRRKSLSVVRADLSFLGVVLPGGSHEVVFRYSPNSVRCGLALGFLGWLGALGFLISGFLRIRSPSG